MDPKVEAETLAVARRLAELGSDRRSRVFRTSWWNRRLMDWAMRREAFKTKLFRFVDVFPATTDDHDVARHVAEYFDGDDVPALLGVGGRAGARVPGGPALVARAARRNIARMAEQFIVGEDAEGAVADLAGLWRAGSAHTVDVLGEQTLLATEADAYAGRVEKLIGVLADAAASWTADHRLEFDDLGRLPRVNVSVKPTALATHYEPLRAPAGIESAKSRLRPLLRRAAERGVFVNFDMEHRDVKDLTLRLFRELLDEEEFERLPAGIAVQAYLRDAHRDLAELISWSARRKEPVTVRLVKGAYWDAETVQARAAGWPVPVFADKAETDANFERCTRLLHDHHGAVRAAFGSHNLRSIAHAVAAARAAGVPDDGYEIQMLHGMAEPTHEAVRRMGLRHRVYCPMGELVPGMAYLVRRLLENTSNDSFVRHRFAEGDDLDELIAPPRPRDGIPGPAEPAERPCTSARRPSAYSPEPTREWRRPAVRDAMSSAVADVAGALGGDVAARIGGHDVETGERLESTDPADPAVRVASSAACGRGEADRAVAAARDVEDEWRNATWHDRAAVCFAVADRLRGRRDELAALEVFEAGKPWDQADGDVCEAIDFCEYYGRAALRLGEGGAVQSPPGERNVMRYQGKGVTAVIAPWNFPLAIPTGMTMAALVTGNPVVLKPAEQTPAIARTLIDAVLDAGVPDGVVGFLPGRGEEVGARLVEHPDVATIAFTGSRQVGLAINAAAARTPEGQRQVKRVIAEMGGKNALIVDRDADLDEAVPAALGSAFGYAGQKCSAASRLIVLDAVHDRFVERLVGAAAELALGHPRDPAVELGPVIDAEAHAKVTGYVAAAPRHGRVVSEPVRLPAAGWFVAPTVVADPDPRSPLATEEIFGPVATVFRARDLDHAIRLANDTPYALTGGVHSRSPSTIDRVGRELRAGNVYVNRTITGSVVGRQPFGGHGLSGVGSKAGGPDYLAQFVDPVVVTENTLRQGFAAPA